MASDSSWRRVRQIDIARAAGVSQATVSYVLSGRGAGGNIPDETRQRILDLARELGYVANPAARNLAGGANRLLGVYTFESVFPIDHHDFYYPFLIGIEAEAESQSHDLVLFTSATNSRGERSVYNGRVNRLGLADGAVLLGKNANRDELVRLRDEGFPFAFIGRREVPGGISYVAADYAAATVSVVEHLADLGHRHLAYVAPKRGEEYSDERERGFAKAVAASGLLVDEIRVDADVVTPDTAYALTLARAGATAFVVHDPHVAMRMHATLTHSGVRVPDQCSLALLNDPPDGVVGPRLTGLRIPRASMGAHAVRLVLDQFHRQPGGASDRSVLLDCEFDLGETTGPAQPHHQRGRSR